MSANRLFHQIEAVDPAHALIARGHARVSMHDKPTEQAYDLDRVGKRELHSPSAARKSAPSASLWARMTGQAKRDEKLAERLARLN